MIAFRIDAQVGIGNPSPHPSSILDLTNTSDKFLVLPMAQSGLALNVNFTAAPEGTLLYFDDNLYFKTSTGTKSLTPWNYNGTAANGVYSNSGTPVGIGIQPIASSPALLQVANASAEVTQTTSSAILMLGSATSGAHLLMDSDEILVKSNATTAGTLKLQEDGGNVEVRSSGADAGVGTVLTAHGSVDAKGKVRENGFDLLPVGSIIMWSGTTVPNGWALCDGGSYALMDGSGNVNTPNLMDRFVVGADATNGTGAAVGSYSSGNTGGSNTSAHDHLVDPPSKSTTANGSHSHTGTTGGPSGTYDPAVSLTTHDVASDNHTHSFTTNTVPNHAHTLNISPFISGGASITENRPPFFALAYIYKL